MDKRFGKTRIPGADKHTVVNGYKGVRIAENPYVLPTNPTIREQIPIRDRGVTFKSRQLDVINIFKDWFQKNGEAPSDAFKSSHTWKTTSRPMYTCRQMSGKWGKDTGCEVEGGRPSSPTHVSTTSKSIQKLNVETGTCRKTLRPLKKPPSVKNLATKMSRYVRDKTSGWLCMRRFETHTHNLFHWFYVVSLDLRVIELLLT
jgi:hypothetical protein